MENGTNTGDMLRMTGMMAVFVGLAWIVQILGWNDGSTLFGRLSWLLSAASVCGAGVGLIVTAGTITMAEPVPVKS